MTWKDSLKAGVLKSPPRWQADAIVPGEIPPNGSAAHNHSGGSQHAGEEQLRRLLEAVVQERDRLLAVVNSISDEIWFADKNGHLTLVKPAGLREFELNVPQPDDVAKLAAELEVLRGDGSPRPVADAPPLRALAGEIICNEDEIVRTPNTGKLRYRQVSSSPVRDTRGGIIGSVSLVRDITRRRRAEEALHASEIMYRTLFEGSKAGILIADEQTRQFRYANPAMCAMLGYTADELLRLGVTDIHPPETVEDTMAAFVEMANGTGDAVETQCLRKDGSVLDVSISSAVAPVAGQGYVFGFFTDITKRKQTEVAQRKSEEKYRKLHESMREAFVSVDMTGRILEYNPAYQEMLGYPDEELRRLNYVDITPEKWHAFEARLIAEQILPLGYSDLYQKEYRRKDGGIITVELRTFLIRDDDGNPASMWAIVRDITGRTRTELALRKSEMRYREIIELAVDGILLGSPEGKITDANTQMQKFAGRRLDQLLGRHISELFDPEDLVAEPLRFDLLNLVRPYVTRRQLLRPDGTKLAVEMHSKRMPDGTYQSIYRDITERQRAENALRHSEAMLNTTQRLSKVGGWEWNIEQQAMFWTEETYRIHDVVPGQVKRGVIERIQRRMECYDPEVRPVVLAAFQRCATEGESYDLELPFTTFAGRRLWIRTTGEAERDGDRIVKVIGNIADITVQKLAEQTMSEWNQTLERRVAERTMELQQSEARFRQLAETTFEGIAVSDDGIVTDCNTQFAAIHGYEPAEMIGRPITDLVAPESRELVVRRMREDCEVTYECFGLRKNSSRFPVEVHARMGTWRGKISRITALRDLTELKSAADKLHAQQTELENAQRLALISEVSAGIIHQIGQPLCAMGANLAAVMARLTACAEKCCGSIQILREVEADVECMREVMTHMRELAHDTRSSRSPNDLNRLLENVLRLLHQEAANHRIRLVVRMEQDLLPVVVDVVQLNQVILNLARNAFDACADCPPERRTVTITTQAVAGPGVELSVSDAGTGIAPEVLGRLFEPFFTTKAAGLGIGLRISRTIIEAHGGGIEAANNHDGMGATFRVILPRHPAMFDV